MKQIQKNKSKAKAEHIAVIDIGSNSIRLVMYDKLGRYPYPLFDERVAAKLGDGLDKTGKIDTSNSKMALEALSRFAQILKSLDPNKIIVVATAVLRRAKNAQGFLKSAEKILNHKIDVITPEEEALFMVNGLTNGMPDLTGLVVDLGGGSTEIAYVKKGEILNSTSLAIGHLSTISSDKIRQKINEVSWLKKLNGQHLFGIGGSFRAIGNTYLRNSNYPVKILHGLHIKSEERDGIIAKLENGDRPPGIPQGRHASIGMAATIIRHLFDAANCNDLVISGTSIRDGLVLSFQKANYKKRDPLHLVCKELANKNSRIAGEGKLIHKFLKKAATASAEMVLKKSELQHKKRLIRAVCLLANICWHEPSEKRGKIAFERILSLPVYGLSHKERVWLGMALFHRYEGIRTPLNSITSADKILTSSEQQYALAIGLGLRFTSIFCAGYVDFLSDAKLSVSGKRLIIFLKQDMIDLMDFHSKRRFQTFAETLSLQSEIQLVQ